MKKQIFKKCMSILTSCIVISSVMASMPLTSNAAENIINSTFEKGTADWDIYKTTGGKASLSTDNGRLAMNVTNLGTVNYGVQLFYDIVPLYKNGVYRLSFDISCTENRFIEAMIQQNGGTYQAYTWQGLNITPQTQTIDYEFTMEYETDIMSKFCFNCGIQKNDPSTLGEHTIYLDNVVLELIDDSNVDYSENAAYESPIVTNQLGFKPNDIKQAVLRFPSSAASSAGFGKFDVINADTKKVAYSGEITGEHVTDYSASGEVCGVADFSDLTQKGEYYIICDGVQDASYSFEISDNPYGNLLDDSVKMLYLQRCGCKVEDSEFGHPACHTSDAIVYGTNTKIDVSGGWHDAGDYGRYVVPAAKTVADLLYAYDANPTLFGDNLGIPESGNGIPDVLDEIRYELDWMLKMQAESGGVYHKVSCAVFPGYIMPEDETDPLIVTPVSTTATADFCASMALAYEYYIDIDKNFAVKCLEAADKAWKFLQENPDLIFENPEDIVTGAYNDRSDSDERYWAAAQMYRATRDSKYLTDFESRTSKTGFDWSTVGDYANVAILTMEDIDKNSTAYTRALSSVKKQADKFVSATEKNPYGASISSFNWGSNMTIANAGMILGLAYQATGDDIYLNIAKANLNHLLGMNPNGYCYVTGYGTVSPQNPHHRPSMAVGKAMKGMLVGGVNSNLEDSAAEAYLAKAAPAKCYIDHAESYSTNEITIYWNSPLICLISLTDDSNNVKGDVNNDGEFSIADVVAMQYWITQNKYPFNTNQWDFINWKSGDLCKDGEINIYDLILMKKMILEK